MDGQAKPEVMILICAGCGEEFAFTASAQEYFFEKGITKLPTHCRSCYRDLEGGIGVREPRPRPPRNPDDHNRLDDSDGR